MSENAQSADNQQGRPDPSLFYYIAGFVDGEGSFHVAVQRNPTVRLEWQVIPEFHVSQHQNSKSVLELIKSTLKCGYVKRNHATSNRDVTWVYVVRNREDLLGKIIPFFRKYRLRTAKRDDFEKFAQIVELLDSKSHANVEGLRKVLKTAFSMNANGQYRKHSLEKILCDLEPSETVRQIPFVRGKDTVRTARRRAEVKRNIHPPDA